MTYKLILLYIDFLVISKITRNLQYIFHHWYMRSDVFSLLTHQCLTRPQKVNNTNLYYIGRFIWIEMIQSSKK